MSGMSLRRVGATLCTLALARSSLVAQQLPRLEPVLEIGCADCSGPALFTTIQSVAWLSDGGILVVDVHEPYLRVFGPDGSARAAFAREGSGPGELRGPAAAAQVGRDTLEVIDIRLHRFARFTMTGQPLRTRSFTRVAFPLITLRDAARTGWVVATTDFRQPTATLRRFRDGIATADSLFTLEPPFPRDREGRPTPYTSYAVGPDGTIYVGEGAFAYRIRRFDGDGVLLGEITRDLPRPQRSDVQMARAEEQRSRSADRVRAMREAEGGSGPGSPPPVRREMNHFDIGALAFDPEGRLWVRTNRGGADRTVFDLFLDAAFLGEVVLDVVIGDWALGPGGLVAEVEAPDFVPRVRTWRWAR